MEYFGFLDQLSSLTFLQVRYLQSFDISQATNHDVFVGCGRYSEATIPFVLTNKGVPKQWKGAFSQTSVTKVVWSCPDEYLAGCPLWNVRPVSPLEAAASLTIIAEDASPDSVFALILLFARLAGVSRASFPPAWINAIDSWELEGLAETPEESWCALESALAHRHFPASSEITDQNLRRAWLDAIRFAADCLRRQVDPLKLPKLPESTEYLYARTALMQERDTYRNWLDRASPIQVVLPLCGTEDREMLVDGLLIEARQVTGATKVYFRTDQTNSPLKRGFAFSAVHTPAKGNDDAEITISVDPSTGLHLRTLWFALEDAENDAWRKAKRIRPASNPRSMEGVENLFDEPWYLTPNATLIGRPRKLISGEQGTFLTWSDVLEVVWNTLGPLSRVEVVSLSTRRHVSLLQLAHEPVRPQHHKVLFAARWVGVADAEFMVMPPHQSTFFSRVLAGILDRASTNHRIGYHKLPPLDSWDTIKLGGGLLVAANAGLFILEDASAEPLDVPAISEAFDHAAELDERLGIFEKTELRPLAEDVKNLLTREHPSSRIDGLLMKAATLETDLAQMRGNLATIPTHPDARRARAVLEEQWSLERRLTTFESEIHAIEISLRSLNELRTLHIGRFIATYGFAIVLAASVAPFAAKAAFHAVHGGLDMDAPGRVIVDWFLGITLALFVFIGIWFGFENPLGRSRKN